MAAFAMEFPHYSGEPSSENEWFEALTSLSRYLRTPEGCPWDREQGPGEFAGFLADEIAELREALDSGDAAHAEEEFGDVFFTLLATAAAAEERGIFNFERALARSHDKMIRRHEHVFGEEKAATPEDAIRIWNAVKAREKAQAQAKDSAKE